MAKHFSEKDIEEFKECYALFAKQGCIVKEEELNIITRSLGFSPTIPELSKYYQERSREGRIDFATFLEIMYEHSKRERVQDEILEGFKAHDIHNTGTIPAAEVRHMLISTGEKIQPQEVDKFFKQVGINPSGKVNYEQFIKIMLTPIPDY